jgi:YfiR/HmsC-like
MLWRIAAALALLAGPHGAATVTTLEYKVKAAYLLNFTKFIAWPPTAFADPAAPFAICVLGADPFGQALDEIVAGESVGGRRLTIRRIGQTPAPQACQLVFFGVTDQRLAASPGRLGPGVLTVGEGQSFLREGGMIAFVIDQHRVRFDINPAAAEGAALKLSSKLLGVARSTQP